jgi:hypothetical protein
MNLPDDDIEVLTLTIDQARKVDRVGEHELLDQIFEAIDKAQAAVFSGEKKRTYVLIEIEA